MNTPDLPGLELLGHPAQMLQALGPLLEKWLGAGARLTDSRVSVLRYVKGKRCIVDLDLGVVHATGGPVQRCRLVAKLYRDGNGAAVYETLQQLWSHGFDRGRFTVCRPLAFDRAWQLLLLSSEPGQTLQSLIVSQQEIRPLMEPAAAWLLKLHTCGITGGRRYDFDRHLHTLTLHHHRLAEACPNAAPVYGAVLRSVAEQAGLAATATPAPTHRDFSPDHLMVDGGRFSGLDFDEFCQYDPLFDVAHFMTHLRLLSLRHFTRLNRLDALAERFRACYENGARDYSADRLRLYLAIAHLKLAYIVGVVQKPPDRERSAVALLREAEQLIAPLLRYPKCALAS